MDETDHLLSSLADHLDAAAAKSLSGEEELEQARSIAADLVDGEPGDDEVDERVEELLALLEDIGGNTGNEEAERHLDAARRAARRVLDR